MTVKRISLKVSPQAALRVPTAREAAFRTLVEAEPLVVLGNDRVPDVLSEAIVASASSCFGPRGACLTSQDGPLWVCDTGHHRLLGWRQLPLKDRTPADWCIGQKDFGLEGRNGKAEANAASVNVPTGICTVANGMAVADTWNHRVLIWHTVPTESNTEADLVLGQSDFTANLANRGADFPNAETLHWPCAVHFHDGKLFVADTGNRRVLVWNQPVTANGQPADLVLGQKDFVTRDENAGAEPSAMSMRWPHAITHWHERLCVTDAGNNRILVWNERPAYSGVAADDVLGQPDTSSVDFNQSLYWPRSNTLNMPYGITAYDDWLIVADTANSRLVAWRGEESDTTCSTAALFGQKDFHEKGDNRWQPAAVDSLCWPYSVQCTDSLLIISDTGNNRVSIWKLAL